MCRTFGAQLIFPSNPALTGGAIDFRRFAASEHRHPKIVDFPDCLAYTFLVLTRFFALKSSRLIPTCCPLSNQPTQPAFFNQSVRVLGQCLWF